MVVERHGHRGNQFRAVQQLHSVGCPPRHLQYSFGGTEVRPQEWFDRKQAVAILVAAMQGGLATLEGIGWRTADSFFGQANSFFDEALGNWIAHCGE